MRIHACQQLFGALPPILFLILPVMAELPARGHEPDPFSVDPGIELPIPHWNLGDRWTVETVSRPVQSRFGLTIKPSSRPIPWQFIMVGPEELDGHTCHRIEVQCQAVGNQPESVLWIDCRSFALRQITTQVPVPHGFEEMTVRYAFASGQTAPVLGPLTALPVDTPVFLSGKAKGLEIFTYRSDFGPIERKSIGDIGFAHQVEQRIAVLSPEQVHVLLDEPFTKSILGDSFTKGMMARPVTEVVLKSHGQEVRQLWQAESPWPIFCDNGSTMSRLVSISRGRITRQDGYPNRLTTSARDASISGTEILDDSSNRANDSTSQESQP
ncbi:MAG: hypothetical protein JW829_12210 [Pirellulales bacterium]|nr:hypothetical protein [Pirellulales bacterium]